MDCLFLAENATRNQDFAYHAMAAALTIAKERFARNAVEEGPTVDVESVDIHQAQAAQAQAIMVIEQISIIHYIAKKLTITMSPILNP